ncbi:BACON domain-containing protein [Alistipes sp.]|uniref:BACON domain-containing protein n=1 Tax=Alistipes sp. TaxID=1872444 RepID=UPI003AB82A77
MRKRNYLKLLLGMFVMVVSTTFMGCVDDNDDTSAPYLKVTPTSLAFNEDGTPKEGDGSFAVEANRPWRVTMDEEAAKWVTVEPASGDGNATVEVRVPATTKGQSAELTFAIYNSYGDLQTQKVTVTQGAVVPAQTIFHTTIGNTAVSSPYPYPDQYEDWNTSGTGAEGVTFSGQNSSVRASGLSNAGAYDGASGPNVVFFGGAPASFTINKIKLTSSQTDLRLTFGGSYSFKNDDGSYDNVFNTDKFHVALSANGTDWKEITYTKNSGDAATPYWVFCTSDFTLDPAVSELYVRFTAEVSSVYRLDDITLATGNGGQIVNLDGDTPTPPVGDEIYNETFGTASVSSPWPYPDQYTDYTKKGSGAATVGYSGQGSSIRNSGLSNANAYEGASGPNVVFFGTNSPYFVVEGITMPSTTNFQLTFGGSYSKRNDDGSYDNTFNVGQFHVSLSADGTTWKEITYTKNNGDADKPYWVFCTSDFTLKSATDKLYIRYAADEASVYRLDDITLKAGNGGQVVDLGSSVTPPVGDEIYNETFGTASVSSPWPYIDQYTDYTKKGTGASTAVYSGEGASIRSSGLSNAGAYEGASGPNMLFLGTGSPYFVVESITMPSTTNFQLTFGGSYSKRNDDGSYDNTFDVAKLHVSLSADGTNWNEITYTKNNGDQDRPYWVFCTADFTLKSATDKLYIRYAADEASVYRLDDMTLKAGNGGQQVDLGGSSQTVTLDVSPMEVTLGNASGATSTFTITTTAAWTATINGSGFTLDKTSGTGNATVTVTSSAAKTGTSAATLGTVTVAATGVSASKTVTVKQNGSSPTPGGNEITVDFGQGPNIATPAIPTTKVTGPVTATYTIAGYEFVVNAPAAYFFQDGSQYGNPEPNKGLYISKQGAYLAFPAIAGKSLQKVVVSTPTSSGSAIEIAINDANGVAAEGGMNQTINSNETVTFNLSNTTENTSYRIEVMNSKNFQINKLVLTYSDGGETPPPAGNPQITAVNPTSVNFTAAGGSQTVNVTVTDQNGAALSASGLSAPFSATVSGNAVTVTATANTGAAVSQTLTIAVAGGNSVTVPVSQAAGSVQPGGGWTTQDFSAAATTSNYNTSETAIVDGWKGLYIRVGAASTAYTSFTGTPISFQVKNKEPYLVSGDLTGGVQALKFESQKTNSCATNNIVVSIMVGGTEVWKKAVPVSTTFADQAANTIDLTSSTDFTAGHSINDLKNATFTLKFAPESNTSANSVAIGNIAWESYE